MDVIPKMLDTLIRVSVRNADDADRRTESLIEAMDKRLEKVHADDEETVTILMATIRVLCDG